MGGKSDKLLLPVPYRSQFLSMKKEEWKRRSCTVVCLKMVLEFFGLAKDADADSLFEESERIQSGMLEKELITQKQASNGKVHEVIVLLSHNHGLPAYKEEFKSLDKEYEGKMLEFGIKKIAASLVNGTPVVASVRPGLSNGQSFHTILIVGNESEKGELKGFYYHDPDSENGNLRDQFIDLAKFQDYWRRLAIFFG